MRQLLIYICLAAFNCSLGYGQGVTSNWYFGANTGIRFENFNPIGVDTSVMYANAGSASISAINSSLLFYGSPTQVFSNEHTTMENGNDILGHPNCNQGALIVQNPVLTSKYYYFSSVISAWPSTGHAHSSVKFGLAHPLGVVLESEKNIELTALSGWSTTAVHHANGKDIWVITRMHQADSMMAFLITENGPSQNPVISYAEHGFISEHGQLKSSPDGNFLAEGTGIGISQSNVQAQVHRFDNTTGMVLGSITITDSILVARGCEFSSNSQFLYFSSTVNGPITGGGIVNQYSLNSFDSALIAESKHTLNVSSPSTALQIGVDRKIYVNPYGQHHLMCIENPNDTGPLVVVTDTSVLLTTGISRHGLPDFIQSYFHPAYFDFSTPCHGMETKFFARTNQADSVLWNFGDTSNADNVSNELNPTHTFSKLDTFSVRLITFSGPSSDTFTREIILLEAPEPPSFDSLYTICDGDSVVLDMSQNMLWVDYYWSNGSTAPTASFTDAGKHWGVVYNGCDTIYDTFQIVIDEPVDLALQKDTTLCEQDSLWLSPELPEGTIHNWSTNQTTPSISVGSWLSNNLEPITISLTASNACGEASDSLTISFIPLPDATLPPDSTHCFDGPIFLRRPSQDSTIYFWSDSSSAETYRLDSTSSVWLSAQNSCGVQIDSFNVLFHPEIKAELGEDTFLCPGDSVVLDARWLESIYTWSSNAVFFDSAQNDGRLAIRYEDVVESGSETYLVTITNGPCSKVEARTIAAVDDRCDSTACKFSIPNVFTPNGDGLNDVLRISNACSDLTFRVFIYNRWGQLMFEDKAAASRYNPASGVATRRDSHIIWDGYLNGEPASAGTYYIVVETDVGRLQKGYFTLMR